MCTYCQRYDTLGAQSVILKGKPNFRCGRRLVRVICIIGKVLCPGCDRDRRAKNRQTEIKSKPSSVLCKKEHSPDELYSGVKGVQRLGEPWQSGNQVYYMAASKRNPTNKRRDIKSSCGNAGKGRRKSLCRAARAM